MSAPGGPYGTGPTGTGPYGTGPYGAAVPCGSACEVRPGGAYRAAGRALSLHEACPKAPYPGG
ncbi:hypothetical protein GCM10018793_02380 [Streptomyces sulfonofaciens]|uniref:Uncharacterized protein n=1 Tax=Streptomyces sulfonofaciens TaxID=68272 RepID=A0A919KQR8_9ACTN|nr:hypothetical protein GCM10018793_02380 [Streptomyces sulfonofaciens]